MILNTIKNITNNKRKITRIAQNYTKLHGYTNTAKRLLKEIADIMLYLLRFSDLAKLDIEEICINKIKKNEKKYPANLSRGRSEKYDKLLSI